MITEQTIEYLCDKIDELRDIIRKHDGGLLGALELPDNFYKELDWLVYDVRTDLRHHNFGDDYVDRGKYERALARIEELEDEEND